MSKKTANEKIIAYKGFDENFQCRGFQFAVGETYQHEGLVQACASGFHACTNPFDVLSYYDVTQRFAVVEASGKIATHDSDSKLACATLYVKAELRLPDFVERCVDFLLDSCKQTDSSELAASGNYSQLAASGDYSKLAASGNYSQLAASGDYSQLAASGDYSKLAASGNSSIACNAGASGRVKGGNKCALSLARWVVAEKRFRITVAYVGENGIKPNTWYELNSVGEFVEVN